MYLVNLFLVPCFIQDVSVLHILFPYIRMNCQTPDYWIIQLQTQYGSAVLHDLRYFEIDVKHNIISLSNNRCLHLFAGNFNFFY